MARVIKKKKLIHTRLAANYGGWMYCDTCDENIGYLCYSTYDHLNFTYQCNCGSQGSVCIDFEDSQLGIECDDAFAVIKNRLCCPKDQEPLMTVLDKKLMCYDLRIACKYCGSVYKKIKYKQAV